MTERGQRMEQNVSIGKSCTICGESNLDSFRVFFDDYLKLFKCMKCGFVAQHLGIGQTKMINYQDSYSIGFLQSGKEFIYPHRKRAFTDIARRIRSLNKKAKKLLDIGCGDGHFLWIVRDLGFECSGVEPSRVLSDYASSKTGAEVRCGYYNKEMYPPDSFDIITLIQVLEHIEDPYALIQTAKYHLHPGGILVIEVPSINSPHFLLYRCTSIKWFVRPPKGVIPSHFGYYSPRSIKFLLKKSGLSEVKMVTGRWKAKYHKKLYPIFCILDSFLDLFKIGGILVFARKEQH